MMDCQWVRCSASGARGLVDDEMEQGGESGLSAPAENADGLPTCGHRVAKWHAVFEHVGAEFALVTERHSRTIGHVRHVAFAGTLQRGVPRPMGLGKPFPPELEQSGVKIAVLDPVGT